MRKAKPILISKVYSVRADNNQTFALLCHLYKKEHSMQLHLCPEKSFIKAISAMREWKLALCHLLVVTIQKADFYLYSDNG